MEKTRPVLVSNEEQKAVVGAIVKNASAIGTPAQVTGQLLKGIFNALGLVPDGDVDYHAALGGGLLVEYEKAKTTEFERRLEDNFRSLFDDE